MSWTNMSSTTTTHSGSHRPSITPMGKGGLSGFFGSKNGDKRSKDLMTTLNQMPVGDLADTILIITATKPHISMIVDKPITLQPGAEIFTFLLGPREKGWKPFGVENLVDVDEDNEVIINRNRAQSSPLKMKTNLSGKSPGLFDSLYYVNCNSCFK